jgi:3-hydroxy-3-methylglutaryl CoA synthase
VGVFSFGSGLASTLLSLRVVGDVSDIAAKIDLHARLAEREKVSPEFYDEVNNPNKPMYEFSANKELDVPYPRTSISAEELHSHREH